MPLAAVCSLCDDVAIKVEGPIKLYQIGNRGTHAIVLPATRPGPLSSPLQPQRPEEG